MFCESKSRPQRGLDLTFRVESVSHSNCVAIQKDHVQYYLGLCESTSGFIEMKFESLRSAHLYSLQMTWHLAVSTLKT